MQTLYTLTAVDNDEPHFLKRTGGTLLNEKLEHALDLFTLGILYTLRIAQYAEVDANQRRSKRLPTEEDLNVNTRIAGNEFLWNILGNNTFNQRVKDSKLEQFINEDLVKKIYRDLVKTPEYEEYITKPEREGKSEKAIMQFIWEKQILESESIQESFTDELQGWEDDKDMTIMLMENFFRGPNKVNFLSLISAEKREYALELMRAVIDREEYVMELIHPKLQNWDPERVAMIDLILLRMGVCEILYFPTIPTKVTINEYIEIAKTYSTPQSGQFVNGVLDNLLKDLEKDNQVRKQERPKKA